MSKKSTKKKSAQNREAVVKKVESVKEVKQNPVKKFFSKENLDCGKGKVFSIGDEVTGLSNDHYELLLSKKIIESR